MLVLTRKAGESVVIDGGIRVQLVEIRGNHVKLGFASPERVRILRSELARGGRESCDDEADLAATG